jgi:hypothetical protein
VRNWESENFFLSTGRVELSFPLGSIPHGSDTHPDLKQTVLDVTIFRHVRCGYVIPITTNQPIHRIASPKLRIEVPAELAITPCASFFWLRLAVKAVHGGSP